MTIRKFIRSRVIRGGGRGLITNWEREGKKASKSPSDLIRYERELVKINNIELDNHRTILENTWKQMYKVWFKQNVQIIEKLRGKIRVSVTSGDRI